MWSNRLICFYNYRDMKKCIPILSLLSLSLLLHTDATFTDQSNTLPPETSSNSMDIAVTDIDKDGDLDVILAMEWRPNLLLLNDGKGHLAKSDKPGFANNNFDSEDIALADFDKDGDLDVVFAAEDDANHEYYLNEGMGEFKTASFAFPRFISNSVATADLDKDGYNDLLFGNQGPEKIFINDKKGGFTDESEKRIPHNNDVTQDVKFADIDRDGDQDIIAGNEDVNKIYLNDGTGIFTDETSVRLPAHPTGANTETRKVTLADVDNDTDLDIYFSNVAFIPGRDLQDRLYLNDGKGKFTDVTSTHLAVDRNHTADAIFMDIDDDRDLDLLLANFNPTGVVVYRNNKGSFTENISGMFPDLRAQSISIINVDLNGDKRDDVYVGNFRSKDFLFLCNK